jgi:hypothetical protein
MRTGHENKFQFYYFFGKLNRFSHKTYIQFLESCAKLRFLKQQALTREVKVLFGVKVKGPIIKRT